MSSKTKTTATKEEATPALVPKLRFPEFRRAEGWKPSVLAAACDMQAGKFVSASNISGRNQAGMCPCYGGNGLRGYTTTHTHDGTYPLIGRQGALCGNVRLASGQFHATEHAVVATPKKAIDVVWLCYSLDLLNLNRFATGQAQPGLSVDVLEKVALAIPPLEPEQQKIAECLSSVDELMAAQARKVDALKTHKKGLMQQLFPREGETQPRLRFPEFQNAGEWEETELGQCLEKPIDYRGKPPPKAESGVPLITARNVRFGWLDMTTDEYIEADAYDAWMTNGIPKAGDILFTTEAPLGNVAMFPSEGRFALGQRIITLRCKTKKCVPEFLFQSLLGPQMQQTIDFHSTGSTAKGIKSSVFVTLNFWHPKVEEQQRIATCLSSLDALITAETQKLEALKTHRKGLMQQLFPAPGVDEP